MAQRLVTCSTVLMLGLAVVALTTAVLGTAKGLAGTQASVVTWRQTTFRGKSVDAADFDHDGRTDLVVANGSFVEIRLADGSGNFARATAFRRGGDGKAPQPIARDFDGDGNSDVAIGYDQSGDVWVFLGDGHGGLSAGRAIQTAGSPSALTAADVDDDGRLDIVATLGETDGSSGIRCVQVLHNDGDGRFTPQAR